MGVGGVLGGATLGGALGGTGVHKYDTGLSRAQRSVVRQGIADALRPLLLPALGGAAGGYLRAIGVLPRPLHDRSEDELGFIGAAVQGKAPCVLVAIGRKDYVASGMDIPSVHYRGNLEIAIYAVSSNQRSFVDGRLATDVVGAISANADPGVETMLEHIEELLLGQELDIESTSEMRPQSEDEVFSGGEETVWEQRYTMQVDRELNPGRTITQLALSIEVANNQDGADPANPVVDTITPLGVP